MIINREYYSVPKLFIRAYLYNGEIFPMLGPPRPSRVNLWEQKKQSPSVSIESEIEKFRWYLHYGIIEPYMSIYSDIAKVLMNEWESNHQIDQSGRGPKIETRFDRLTSQDASGKTLSDSDSMNEMNRFCLRDMTSQPPVSIPDRTTPRYRVSVERRSGLFWEIDRNIV